MTTLIILVAVLIPFTGLHAFWGLSHAVKAVNEGLSADEQLELLHSARLLVITSTIMATVLALVLAAIGVRAIRLGLTRQTTRLAETTLAIRNAIDNANQTELHALADQLAQDVQELDTLLNGPTRAKT